MENELAEVQTEYLKLLTSISSRLEQEDLLVILDEIQLFWYQKRNIINMATKHLFGNKDAYILTAATIFGFENSDQDIMFVNGKYQVFDDPVPTYLSIVSKKEVLGDVFSLYLENLSTRITETIEDEIKLLEAEYENFYIIPLRYYLNLYLLVDHLDNISKKIINTIFIKPKTYEELSNVKNVESVVNQDILTNFVFFDGDDVSLSLTERIEEYIRSNRDMIPEGANKSQILYTILLGGLRQALEIIEMSLQFNVIPFFRSFIPFNNFNQVLQIIIDNSTDKKEIRKMKLLLNKTAIEYLLYFEFTRINEGNHTINELKKISMEKNFQNKLQLIVDDMDGLNNFSKTAQEIKKLVYELLE